MIAGSLRLSIHKDMQTAATAQTAAPASSVQAIGALLLRPLARCGARSSVSFGLAGAFAARPIKYDTTSSTPRGLDDDLPGQNTPKNANISDRFVFGRMLSPLFACTMVRLRARARASTFFRV